MKDFYKQLQNADWFAAYSDDRHVRNRGEERLDALKAEATAKGPEFVELFTAFRDHKWRGAPKPAEPVA